MAVGYNPRIVTDGLVLALDGANYKSFKGEATTNVVTNTNLDTGWSKTYNTNIQWNDYSPPDNVNSQVVSFVDSDGNGSGYWYSYGDYAPQSPSTTYTISVYARTIGSDWNIQAYTADNSETGRQWTNTVTVPGDGKWHRVVFDSITTPADTQSDSLSFYFSSIPAGQRCWLCAPQMEAKSYATTFTTGTRGTTVATGGGWKDLFGSNNGELVNGVRESTDGGGCLVFDGTNDYVSISHNADIDFNNSTVIYVAQLSSSPNSRNTVFSKYNGTGAQHEWSSAGYLRSNYRDASASTPELDAPNGTSQVSTNTIYHITVTYNNKTIEHFKNGVSLGSSTNSTHNTVNNTTNIGIGYNTSAGLYFKGNIYTVSIYNRVLSTEEIKQNFNAVRGRFGI